MVPHCLLTIAGCVALLLLPGSPAKAQWIPPGSTSRVSVSTGGGEGSFHSFDAALSSDGAAVAFHSFANNLVLGDTNGVPDVFLHDRATGVTTRMSVSTLGAEGNGDSLHAAISADGRFVAFESAATNLVPGDTNGVQDVFVHDRLTLTTTRVSLGPGGAQGNGYSRNASISATGRFVAFESFASNLVPGDFNFRQDVFVHDRQTGGTVRASVSSSGSEGNLLSGTPRLSADGTLVVFSSAATNLVPGDTNAAVDIFLRDLLSLTTVRVSVSSAGTEANGPSSAPAISGDGQWVTFDSLATNLVPGDGNNASDVFLHDRLSGLTALVSASSSGVQGNGASTAPSLPLDGTLVAFQSHASNLVTGDVNGVRDVFLNDRSASITSLISISTTGVPADYDACQPSLSAEGRHVAFDSLATMLVTGDTNGAWDVFLRDRGPWVNLGCALAGVTGDPLLTGSGTLLPLTTASLDLANAAPNAVAVLSISTVSQPLPFAGGTVKAWPPSFLGIFLTSALGQIQGPFLWPAGVPPGLRLYAQYAVVDSAAVLGVALSNAVGIR